MPYVLVLIVAAIGRLSAANLNLAVTKYDPAVHFDQVKDKWVGLRTPDGREPAIALAW